MILITKLGRNNLETMGASSIRSNDERENVELNSNLERLFAARALHGDIYWKIFLQRVEILLNGANGKEGFSEFTKNSDMIWKRANEVQIVKIHLKSFPKTRVIRDYSNTIQQKQTHARKYILYS